MFAKLKAYLPKDSFLKHVIVLAGSTTFSQSLLILVAPILTRLYAPEDFGLLAVLISLLSIAQVVVSLRYEMAIPLAEDNSVATHLLGLSLGLVWFISILLGVIFWYFATDIAQWLNVPGFSNYIGLLIIGLLGAGSYFALKYWCTKNQLFRLISVTQIWQSITQVILQIALGIGQIGGVGLVWGYVVAQWVGILALLKPVKPFFSSLNPRTWLTVATTYKHFPLYTLWTSLLTVLSWQVPPLLLAAYFSVEIVGWYALTIRVLAMPSAFIGQAVAQVFYPMAAQAALETGATTFVERVTCLLFVLGFSVFAFLLLQGKLLFLLVFGQEWAIAGLYAQWLAPWLMLAFISSPLSTFTLVKSRQRQAFLFTLYGTILRLGAMSLGIYIGSAAIAIQLFSAAGVVVYFVYIIWILHLAGSSIWIIIERLKKIIFIGVLIVASLLLLDMVLAPFLSLGLTALGLAGFGAWAYVQFLQIFD